MPAGRGGVGRCVVISRNELAALSPAERAELARALAELNTSPPGPRARRRRQAFILFCCVAAVALAAWTVTLSLTLPRRQAVGQWRTVWVGFDIAEIVAFSVAGWAAWRGRQLLIPAALVSGALLLCDAWFDVVLSWNTAQRWQSLLSALLFEVPLAALLWAVARSLVLRTVRLARSQLGLLDAPPPLHRLVLFAGIAEISSGSRAQS